MLHQVGCQLFNSACRPSWKWAAHHSTALPRSSTPVVTVPRAEASGAYAGAMVWRQNLPPTHPTSLLAPQLASSALNRTQPPPAWRGRQKGELWDLSKLIQQIFLILKLISTFKVVQVMRGAMEKLGSNCSRLDLEWNCLPLIFWSVSRNILKLAVLPIWVGINSQSLEDTQVEYNSQKYT